MIQSTGLSTRASLLLRIRDNPADQAAWQAFVSRFAPLIHSWCRSWKLQESDAQDITQNVLLKIARTLPDFVYEPTRSFRGWLRTITRHAWSDFIESQWKSVPAAGTHAVSELLQSIEARDDFFRRVQAGFDEELAEQAMEQVRARVEPHTWEAFRLTAVEEVPAGEVAKRLKIQVGTVYRARNVVQGMLRETMAVLDGGGSGLLLTVAACPSQEELRRYLDGKLAEADERSVASHIENCQSCQSLLDRLVATNIPVKSAFAQKEESLFVQQLRALDITLITGSQPRSAADQFPTELPIIPNYEVLGEVGRGGMGIVYRARHLALRREVAIKMLPAAAQLDESDRRRFKTEAETVARLQHPNIVQLFEIGEVAGQPYLVFEYVAGGTLQQKLAGRPQPQREAAALVEILARAVHAAHVQHIIHRDLKPANVLLIDVVGSRYGFPKLTDFGLAKQLDAHTAGTTRSLSGTPAYMAPEQVTGDMPGKPRPITAATDVYALGVILFEMLTGRPPFFSSDWMATLLQVERAEPVSPRVLQPATPRDLETVCLKCLEKDPSRRYATAAELADDIGRYLRGEPTIARPVSPVGRFVKTVRRYPLVASLAGMVAITLVGGLVTALVLWQSAAGARNDLHAALQDVQKQRENAELNVYFGRISQSQLLWDAGDAEQARELLAACEPAPGQADLRGWEWHYLRRLFHPETKVRTFPFWVNDLALLPAVPGQPDELAVAVGQPFWNRTYKPKPEDGRGGAVPFDDSSPFKDWSVPLPSGSSAVAVQSEGPLVAWGTTSGDVVVMDRQTGRHIRTIRLKSGVRCLRFLSGSDRLIVSFGSSGLQVIDPIAGEQVENVVTRAKAKGIFAVNPAGTLLACGGEASKYVEFFELPSLKSIGEPLLERSEVTALAFSPDGKTLLSGSEEGTISVWNPTEHREIRRLEDHSGAVYAIAFASDGKTFASGGADRVVRLWDVGAAKPARLYRGHSDSVRSLIFSRDGQRLASASQDSTLRTWNPTVDPRGMLLPFHDRLNAIAFSENDGNPVIRGDQMNSAVATWAIPGGVKLSEFALPKQGHDLYPIRYVDFLNGGRTVVAVPNANDHQLTFVDAATGQQQERLIAAHGRIQTLAADASGRWLVWAESEVDNETRIRRWDEQNQREFEPITLNVKRIRTLAYDAVHGRIAAIAEPPESSAERSLWIADANGGEIPRELSRSTGMIGGLAFSNSGDRLAVSARETIVIFDAEKSELKHTAPSLPNITNIAFSADDRRLAAIGYDGVVVLADPTAGARILQLRGLAANRPVAHASDARVAFSPDGNWLASSTWNGSLILWNGSPIAAARKQLSGK